MAAISGRLATGVDKGAPEIKQYECFAFIVCVCLCLLGCRVNPAISIQETDGSYFETFTSLAWKRENRRLSSMRAAEARAEIIPDNEREPTTDEDQQQQLQHPEQKEQLYVDVLYTIANSVGQPGSQVSWGMGNDLNTAD